MNSFLARPWAIVVVGLLAASSPLLGGDPGALLEPATKAFATASKPEDYLRIAGSYEQGCNLSHNPPDLHASILAEERCTRTADFYRNLGVAYWKAGRGAAALAAYRQAQKLAPRLAGPGEMIARLRKELAVPAGIGARDDAAFASPVPFTLTELLIAAAGCATVAAMLSLPALFINVSGSVVAIRWTAFGLGAALLCGAVMLSGLDSSRLDLSTVSRETALRADRFVTDGVAPESPADKLSDGQEVWVLERAGDAALVRASNGRAGWIDAADLARPADNASKRQRRGMELLARLSGIGDGRR